MNLLPTPVVNDMGNGKTPPQWDGWTADMRGKHGNGNGHGKSLAIEVQRLLPTLLPTPTRRDHKGRNQRDDNTCLPGAVGDYGQYAPAIQRWEHTIGEPSPPPTIQGAKRPRLNPDLPRWMMGFPPGWLDGLTPAQQLKAVGNAVCQQQAELALRILLGDS